jgi:hypothetical protein
MGEPRGHWSATPWSWNRRISTDELDNDYQMFEYPCHEGNYGLPNILSAARAAEKPGPPK